MNLKNIVRNIISESDNAPLENASNKRILDVYVAYSEFQSKKRGAALQKNIFLNIANLRTKDVGVANSIYKATIPRGQERGKEEKVCYRMPAHEAEGFFKKPWFGGLMEHLKETNLYLMPDNLNDVVDEVMSGNLDAIDKVKLTKQNERYTKLFDTLIGSLDSPETKKLLQTISKIGFNINEEIYGKVRSPENVLRTYAVKRDSTFVASRGGWRAFNRRVVSNATPIYLSVPNVNKRDTDKAEKQLGISQGEAINLGPHVSDSFKSHTTVDIDGFQFVSFYDVSDTEVYSNKEDLWERTAGLVDNLQGVLNSIAKENLAVDKEEMDKLGLKTDESKNGQFSKVFIRLLEKNPDAVSPDELGSLKKMNPNDDNTVYKLLDTYFRNVFDRGNEDKIKNAKILASVVAVMTIEDVANPKRISLLATHEKNVADLLKSKASWVSISLPVTNLIKLIGDNLNESLNENMYVSPEFIMGLFNVTPNMLDNEEDDSVSSEDGLGIKEGNKETIREEFFRIFNKIKNE